MCRLSLAALALAAPLCWGSPPARAANCPTVLADCPNVNANDGGFGGKLTGKSLTWLSAVDYGVKADAVLNATTGALVSGTSDDLALKAAVDACAAKGARLVLPPGKILLTGAATISLRDCHMEGAGPIQGTLGDAGSYGTTILLTSTTIKPFITGNSWGVTGVQFYWPNQLDGVTHYEPLFSPIGGEGTNTYGWYLDHVTIVNAYDAIVENGGSFRVTNSWIYAVNDGFRATYVGDGFFVSGVHFTPGPWFTLTNFAATSVIGAVTDHNTIFHFTANPLSSDPVAINFGGTNLGAFAWRYGVKVENNVQVGLSEFQVGFDGVQTIIDTASGGGQWAGANVPVRGIANCTKVSFTGRVRSNKAVGPPGPCFNLGDRDTLYLSDFNASSNGSFVETNGGNVLMDNAAASIGNAKDGGDYYVAHVKTNPGGVNVSIKNSFFQGQSGGSAPDTLHTHGVMSPAIVPRLSVQNSEFLYFHDVLDFIPGPSALITGNWIDVTTGPEAIVSASMNGSNFGVLYRDNSVDKPPRATCTGCGAGYQIAGGFRGEILLGTGPVTAFTLHLPWNTVGPPSCQFNVEASGVTIGGFALSTLPPAINVTVSADITGGRVAFDCRGQD